MDQPSETKSTTVEAFTRMERKTLTEALDHIRKLRPHSSFLHWVHALLFLVFAATDSNHAGHAAAFVAVARVLSQLQLFLGKTLSDPDFWKPSQVRPPGLWHNMAQLPAYKLTKKSAKALKRVCLAHNVLKERDVDWISNVMVFLSGFPRGEMLEYVRRLDARFVHEFVFIAVKGQNWKKNFVEHYDSQMHRLHIITYDMDSDTFDENLGVYTQGIKPDVSFQNAFNWCKNTYAFVKTQQDEEREAFHAREKAKDADEKKEKITPQGETVLDMDEEEKPQFGNLSETESDGSLEEVELNEKIKFHENVVDPQGTAKNIVEIMRQLQKMQEQMSKLQASKPKAPAPQKKKSTVINAIKDSSKIFKAATDPANDNPTDDVETLKIRGKAVFKAGRAWLKTHWKILISLVIGLILFLVALVAPKFQPKRMKNGLFFKSRLHYVVGLLYCFFPEKRNVMLGAAHLARAANYFTPTEMGSALHSAFSMFGLTEHFVQVVFAVRTILVHGYVRPHLFSKEEMAEVVFEEADGWFDFEADDKRKTLEKKKSLKKTKGNKKRNSKKGRRNYVNYDKLVDDDTVAWIDEDGEYQEAHWRNVKGQGLFASGDVQVVAIIRNGQHLRMDDLASESLSHPKETPKKQPESAPPAPVKEKEEKAQPKAKAPNGPKIPIPPPGAPVHPCDICVSKKIPIKKIKHTTSEHRDRKVATTPPQPKEVVPKIAAKASKRESEEPLHQVTQMAKDNVLIDPEAIQGHCRVIRSDTSEKRVAAAFCSGSFMYINIHVVESDDNLFVCSDPVLDGHDKRYRLKELKGAQCGPDLMRFNLQQNGIAFQGTGRVKIIPPSIHMPVMLFALKDNGKLTISTGYITDIDSDIGTFGFSGTTLEGHCGGVYVHQLTGSVVGIHFLGSSGKTPNRGIIFPKN